MFQVFRIIENVWHTGEGPAEKTKIQPEELTKHRTEAAQKVPQKGLGKTVT
jgi:hypothetical protein